MKKLTLAALAAAAVVSSVPASAALLFEYTAINSKTAQPTLSFTIDSATPTPFAYNDSGFNLSSVTGTVCTNSGCNTLTSPVSFYLVEAGGLFNGFGFDLYGDKVFKGDPSAPLLVTGTFDAADNIGTPLGTLVISEISGAVPEAATWAMLIAGFGMVGAATRRRRTSVSVTYA
jgi:ABC-type amino acid transport substrate-binding protein